MRNTSVSPRKPPSFAAFSHGAEADFAGAEAGAVTAGTFIDSSPCAFTLNARPRKSLGCKCPVELFLREGTFDFRAYWAAKLKTVALGA